MSSKIFTTVLVVAIVGSFGYFATQDAVSTKQDLQNQTAQIEQLTAESAELDQKIESVKQTKVQTEQEVESLDRQAKEAAEERKRLEAELGAN